MKNNGIKIKALIKTTEILPIQTSNALCYLKMQETTQVMDAMNFYFLEDVGFAFLAFLYYSLLNL